MAITINVNLDEILQALKNDLDFTGNADKYIKVNATADGFEFAAVSVGSTWGSITGTLSDQTDLQNAFDLKANLSGAAFTGDVSVTTSGSGDTLQLINSGSGTTLNITNSGSGDFLTIDSTKLVIDNGGDVSIGTATASARFHVLTGSTSKVGQIIQAAAGQTANLLEVNSSGGSGGDLFKIENDGDTLTGNLTINAGSNRQPNLFMFRGASLQGGIYTSNSGVGGFSPTFHMGILTANNTSSVRFYNNGTLFQLPIQIGDTATFGNDTWLTLSPSTASRSHIKFNAGVDPTTPNAGDMWFDGTNLKFYDGSTTHNIV